jgi:hypothetical protein
LKFLNIANKNQELFPTEEETSIKRTSLEESITLLDKKAEKTIETMTKADSSKRGKILSRINRGSL